MARNAFWLALLLVLPAALEGAVCNRTDRSGLSSLAATVLARIEASPSTLAKSSVPQSLLLSTCNRFDSIRIEGPDIYAAVRDAIAGADHEVDMAFYQWEADSYASFLIGSGLIAAQARRTALDPLLVRIVIDDIECSVFCPDRAVNHLYDSRKAWVQRGLDLARVKIQFGTSPRASAIAPNLHDKFVVADVRRVVVTGANVENVHNPGFPWHDSGYVLEGDAGRSALAAFEHTWLGNAHHWLCSPQGLSNDCDTTSAPFPQPSRPWLPALGTTRLGDVPVLAVGRVKEGITTNNVDNPQDTAWLTLMEKAVSNLHIESPNINDDAFRNAVVQTVQRGVPVRLLVPLGFNNGIFGSDGPGQGGDNEEVIGDLRQRVRQQAPAFQDRFEVRWYSRDGFEPIWGNGPGANHTKYMSVDNRVAVVGSGNMETPAWNFSHEYNLLIDDAAVTAGLESTLFLRDWSTSIGGYAELYEGNGGTQSLVCPLAVNRPKAVPFWSYPACQNDEARSAVLVDLPAGVVLRLYDEGDLGYQDDDWTEIVVKRAVKRKALDSFEASFEDADVRVTYHRDNGLDGKVSSADVMGTPAGPVIDLYSGNNGTGGLTCSNRAAANRTVNLTQDPYCNNDDARSLKLYDFPTNKVIFLHDDSGGSSGDDWAVIVPQRAIREATVPTFETSATTADYRVCFFRNNGLDGKVSRMRIGSIGEAAGLCGVPAPPPPPPPVCGDGLCAGGESCSTCALDCGPCNCGPLIFCP